MGAWGATAGNVKRLLPPRQSRGISFVSLGGDTMTRVTDFRVDTVEIPEHDYYTKVPAEARRLIEAYWTGARAMPNGNIRFEIAIYRWAEIEPLMRRLGGPKR